MDIQNIELTPDLKDLCIKWNISRLSLFGSFAKELQNETSDVDLLVSFLPGVRMSLLDHVRLKREFEIYFGRKVDLLTQSALSRMKNEERKKSISEHIKVIYAA